MPLKTKVYHDSGALWTICITAKPLTSSHYTVRTVRFVLCFFCTNFSVCTIYCLTCIHLLENAGKIAYATIISFAILVTLYVKYLRLKLQNFNINLSQ